MTTTVREATTDDLGTIVRLLGELYVVSTAVADPDSWGAMLARTGRTILLAARNGEPAGTADLWITDARASGEL